MTPSNFDIIRAAARCDNLLQLAVKLKLSPEETIVRLYRLRLRGIAVRFPRTQPARQKRQT